MLLGYPVALISVVIAFSLGGGRVYAFAAFVLVAVPAVLLALALSGQFGQPRW